MLMNAIFLSKNNIRRMGFIKSHRACARLDLASKPVRFLLLLFLILLSCEKDDICVDGDTPHLIIRFYDKDCLLYTSDAADD